MKKRFGLTPFFSGDKPSENSEIISGPAGGEYAPSFDQEKYNKDLLDPISTEQNDKLLEIERTSKRLDDLRLNIEEFARLSSEMATNMNAASKVSEFARNELRQHINIKRDNKELTDELTAISLEHAQVKRDLEMAHSEISSLKKNGDDLQVALTDARDSIYNMRESNKKSSESFRETMAANLQLKNSMSELNDRYEDLSTKFETVDGQKNAFKSELDLTNKRLGELQSELEEKDGQLLAQSKENKTIIAEIGMLERHVANLKDEKVQNQVTIQSAKEELSNFKRTTELEQRKHDNEIYSRRAEIENLTSQLRLLKSTQKDSSVEIRAMKERDRSMKKRIQELEMKLEDAQGVREKNNEEIREQSVKLHELNLQYETALIELKQEKSEVAELNRTLLQLRKDNEKTQSMRIKYEAAAEQIEALRALIQEHQLGKQLGSFGEDHKEENGEARASHSASGNVVSINAEKE